MMMKKTLALRNEHLAAAALGLGLLAAGIYAHNSSKPAPVASAPVIVLPIRAVLTEKPKVPEVKNLACGPEKTFPSVMFDCVGDRPRAVQIENVALIFADAKAGQVDQVCAVGRDKCRPVSALSEDERSGFDWWRSQAFSRYRP